MATRTLARALLLAALLFVAVCAFPRAVVEEAHRDGHPAGWERVRDAPLQEAVRLYFGLEMNHEEWLEKELMDVSSLRSARYGAHLSMQELQQKTAPSHASARALEQWLEGEGVLWRPLVVGGLLQEFKSASDQALSTGWVAVELEVAQAAALLGQEASCWGEWVHSEARMRALRCLEGYSLPAHVAPAVAFVGGVHELPGVLHRLNRLSGARETPPADMIVNPAAIREHYNCSTSYWGSDPSNSQAVGKPS